LGFAAIAITSFVVLSGATAWLMVLPVLSAAGELVGGVSA
jgi:hypothetical protein